ARTHAGGELGTGEPQRPPGRAGSNDGCCTQRARRHGWSSDQGIAARASDRARARGRPGGARRHWAGRAPRWRGARAGTGRDGGMVAEDVENAPVGGVSSAGAAATAAPAAASEAEVAIVTM